MWGVCSYQTTTLRCLCIGTDHKCKLNHKCSVTRTSWEKEKEQKIPSVGQTKWKWNKRERNQKWNAINPYGKCSVHLLLLPLFCLFLCFFFYLFISMSTPLSFVYVCSLSLTKGASTHCDVWMTASNLYSISNEIKKEQQQQLALHFSFRFACTVCGSLVLSEFLVASSFFIVCICVCAFWLISIMVQQQQQHSDRTNSLCEWNRFFRMCREYRTMIIARSFSDRWKKWILFLSSLQCVQMLLHKPNNCLNENN